LKWDETGEGSEQAEHGDGEHLLWRSQKGPAIHNDVWRVGI
jgi:hypothetical protein